MNRALHRRYWRTWAGVRSVLRTFGAGPQAIEAARKRIQAGVFPRSHLELNDKETLRLIGEFRATALVLVTLRRRAEAAGGKDPGAYAGDLAKKIIGREVSELSRPELLKLCAILGRRARVTELDQQTGA